MLISRSIYQAYYKHQNILCYPIVLFKCLEYKFSSLSPSTLCFQITSEHSRKHQKKTRSAEQLTLSNSPEHLLFFNFISILSELFLKFQKMTCIVKPLEAVKGTGKWIAVAEISYTLKHFRTCFVRLYTRKCRNLYLACKSLLLSSFRNIVFSADIVSKQ